MSKENLKNEEAVEDIAVKEESVQGTVEYIPSKWDKLKENGKKFGKRFLKVVAVCAGVVTVYTIGERNGKKKAMAENSDNVYELVEDTDTTSENNVE